MTLDPTALDFSDAIARRAFRPLLDSPQPLTAATLAGEADSDERRVVQLLSALKAAGRVELDERGQLVGIYGLTLRPTQHRLQIRGNSYFVWCAFDAVGIPAALGESASVTSICAQCCRELSFRIEQGEPPSLPLVISWLPRACDSIREEFCPTINFYCDADQFRSSIADGQPENAFLTLAAAAQIGRENWGWAAAGR